MLNLRIENLFFSLTNSTEGKKYGWKIINLRYLFPYIIIPKHFLIPIFHDSSNLLFPHITSPKKLLFQIKIIILELNLNS